MFEGRRLVIGTKHGKERVIAPPVEAALSVITVTSPSFDTDLFGTFSGEVERKDDPVSAVRSKCKAAMDLVGCELGIASEGSFGPHPQITLIPADEELLIFIDRENDLEVIHRELSTETNFSGKEVETRDQLLDFAEKASFPSHGLILRNAKNGLGALFKGITDSDTLLQRFEGIVAVHGTAYVETDMRAMYNPMRMELIARTTRGLLEKIQSRCPACGAPGFIVSETLSGLPCSRCHAPTRSIMTVIRTCRRCGHHESKGRPDGKSREDPMFCDFCNP